MNFWQIGSLSQYTKGLARQTQWKLKKQSGDLSAHYKSLTDQVSFTKASDVFPYQDERDDKLSAIITKAQAGKKLSPDEWDYVRSKRPELYAQLRQLEEEAKAYEEELKRCKAKDEAQRLHMTKLSGAMAQAKNGDESALIRLNRLTQTMTAFTESQSYHEMPSEAEEAIERENQRQTKVDAMQAEAEAQKEARQQALAEVTQDTSNDAPDNPRQVAAEAATNSLEHTVSGSEEAHDKVTGPGVAPFRYRWARTTGPLSSLSFRFHRCEAISGAFGRTPSVRSRRQGTRALGLCSRQAGLFEPE